MGAPGTVDVDVGWRGEILAGTLHLPAGTGPAPLLVMIQGSGPADRDADGYFTAIRATFLERGIATYSFDKPGCGASTGDWRRYALHDRADQVTTVLDAVAGRPEVDASRLGIWGQSQGGWITQIVAADRHDLAFAIANSGPSISVEEQDLFACEHRMRADGRSPDDVTAALDVVRQFHAAAASRATYDEIRTNLTAAPDGGPWDGYLEFDSAADWDLVVAFATEAYEPLPTLGRVTCPFLAVFGGRDVLVPAWRGAHEVGTALQGCTDATVVVFPGGDHRIQTGGPLEFAPGYLDLLGDWASARLTPGAT